MSILITPLSISRLSITIRIESLREIRYLLVITIDRCIINSLGCSLSSSSEASAAITRSVGGAGSTGTRGTVDRRARHKEHPKDGDRAYEHA
jgi:hypothetical protein